MRGAFKHGPYHLSSYLVFYLFLYHISNEWPATPISGPKNTHTHTHTN